MKIAIFGGSFDPVHAGHEAVVKEALKTLAVDKLFIVPTFISPHKSAFAAPPALRLRWLARVFEASGEADALTPPDDYQNRGRPERLLTPPDDWLFGGRPERISAAGKLATDAAADLSALSATPVVPERLVCKDARIEILGCEINAARPVPSIETARAIAADYAPSELFFIIGADHLKNLHSWHEIAALQRLARFVVASRGRAAIPSEFMRLDVAQDVSSSDVRRLLKLQMVDGKILSEVKNFYGEKYENQTNY